MKTSKKAISEIESSKVMNMIEIRGGEVIPSPREGTTNCTDTFNYTERNIYDANGNVVGTVNDRDNVQWWAAPGVPCTK